MAGSMELSKFKVSKVTILYPNNPIKSGKRETPLMQWKQHTQRNKTNKQKKKHMRIADILHG
jgi:hypothetical protein